MAGSCRASAQCPFEALTLFQGVKLGPGMLLTVQVEGQAVDVNDPLFVVVHRAVHPDAGGMESPAGVEVVQGVLVFGAAVGPYRKGRSVLSVLEASYTIQVPPRPISRRTE